MARVIKNFQIQNPNGALTQINSFLQSEGYEYTDYAGERVFKKGKGVWSGPSFFKFEVNGNTIHLETWMKYALLPGVYVGELGLTGMVGAAVKGNWKKRIEKIESIISSYNGTVSNTYAQSSQTVVNNKNTCNHCGAELISGMSFCSNCGQPVAQVDDKTNDDTSSVEYNQSVKNYCNYCGTELTGNAAFCTNCGKPNPSHQNSSMLKTENVSSSGKNCESVPEGLSKKDYVKKYLSPKLIKDIKSISILCYVCAGITFLISIFLNPLGIIDALLLLGFTLGMQFGRNKVFAILILVLSALEVILSIISGAPAGILWLIAGIWSVITFNKIDKEYQAYLNK